MTRWFQSTPAIDGRRNGRGFDYRTTKEFQSTPAIDGRRNAIMLSRTAQDHRFQSTPAIDGRRNFSSHSLTLFTKVSIHSGHRWPEKCEYARMAPLLHLCFNPLRPSMAGEMGSQGMWEQMRRLFQSTPAIDGRRNSNRCRLCTTRQCFNPLRPSMAGDIAIRREPREIVEGFNPLRPSMAGEIAVSAGSLGRLEFQSTPAIDGRRNICRAQDIMHSKAVSIHSGHRWPEKSSRAANSRTRKLFQSTPAIDGRRNA